MNPLVDRRAYARLAASIGGVWIFAAALFAYASGNVARSMLAAGAFVGVATGALLGVVALAWLPSLANQAVAALVAKRNRLTVAAFCVGSTCFTRKVAGGWTRTRRRSTESVPCVWLGATDENDLRARLRRVWLVPGFVGGVMTILWIVVSISLVGVIYRVPGTQWLYAVIAIGGLSQLATFFATFREDLRSPRLVAFRLRTENVATARECAHALVTGARLARVRPRDENPAAYDVIAEEIREAPTLWSLRFYLLCFLLDREEEIGIAAQRAELLALEAPLKRTIADPMAQASVWFVAYGSPTAEEAERIRDWVETWHSSLAPAHEWLEAKIEALHGRPKEARRRALAARAMYERTDEGNRVGFEIEAIDRFLATLEPVAT